MEEIIRHYVLEDRILGTVNVRSRDMFYMNRKAYYEIKENELNLIKGKLSKKHYRDLSTDTSVTVYF